MLKLLLACALVSFNLFAQNRADELKKLQDEFEKSHQEYLSVEKSRSEQLEELKRKNPEMRYWDLEQDPQIDRLTSAEKALNKQNLKLFEAIATQMSAEDKEQIAWFIPYVQRLPHTYFPWQAHHLQYSLVALQKIGSERAAKVIVSYLEQYGKNDSHAALFCPLYQGGEDVFTILSSFKNSPTAVNFFVHYFMLGSHYGKRTGPHLLQMNLDLVLPAIFEKLPEVNWDEPIQEGGRHIGLLLSKIINHPNLSPEMKGKVLGWYWRELSDVIGKAKFHIQKLKENRQSDIKLLDQELAEIEMAEDFMSDK